MLNVRIKRPVVTVAVMAGLAAAVVPAGGSASTQDTKTAYDHSGSPQAVAPHVHLASWRP
jgi:hypothetical protein